MTPNTPTPSERAIALAFRELSGTHLASRHSRADEFGSAIQQRAREIDAERRHDAAPEAEAVRDAEPELLAAARAYLNDWCADEADDEVEPGSTRGTWTGCHRDQRDAALRLKRAVQAAIAARGALPGVE